METLMRFAVISLLLAVALHLAPLRAQKVRIVNLYDAFGEVTPGTAFDWGYSAYIEYGGRRILFDAGNDPGLLQRNAHALGVDLSRVDIAVLSHRHWDHASGFDHLLRVNPKVKLYLPNDTALGAPFRFALAERDLRAAESLPTRQRYFRGEKQAFEYDPGDRFWGADVEFVGSDRTVAPGIRLIATRAGDRNMPELSLALDQGERITLITGCSHSGLDVIVSAARRGTGKDVGLLAGGYHLSWESDESILDIAHRLRGPLGVRQVAPAHCTGHRAFKALQDLYGADFIFAGLGSRIETGPSPSSRKK